MNVQPETRDAPDETSRGDTTPFGRNQPRNQLQPQNGTPTKHSGDDCALPDNSFIADTNHAPAQRNSTCDAPPSLSGAKRGPGVRNIHRARRPPYPRPAGSHLGDPRSQRNKARMTHAPNRNVRYPRSQPSAKRTFERGVHVIHQHNGIEHAMRLPPSSTKQTSECGVRAASCYAHP